MSALSFLMILDMLCRYFEKEWGHSISSLSSPINLICRCQFWESSCTANKLRRLGPVEMSKPRLLCCAKNTFCKKIFSAHRRWKMALALSWSKISTRERKCDKQSVALWTLCALFSWGSLRGHTWKFLFFAYPQICEAHTKFRLHVLRNFRGPEQ